MRKAEPSNYDILKQVPADYYASGVEKNLLQKIWHKRKWAVLEKLLAGSSGKLLDVGCCDGTTSYHISLISPKLKVTGVDLYKEALEFGKKRYKNVDFVLSDAQKLPFKSGTFNYVTAIEVLEHLDDPDKALSEIKRVLKPNGILIIGQDTDSFLFKSIWWFWGRTKGAVWQNSHISCETPDKLLKRVKRHGFKIKGTKFHNLKMEIFITAQKVR